MSWNVEVSVLTGERPMKSADCFPWRDDQLSQPEWIRHRTVIYADETVAEAWELFAEWMATLGVHAVSRQGWTLLLFHGASAAEQANRLVVVPVKLYRRISIMAREKECWPDSTLVKEIQSLRDPARLLLSSLDTDTVGIMRVYEWGKF